MQHDAAGGCVAAAGAQEHTAAELARANRALRLLSHSNQALIRAADEAALLTEVCRIAVDEGGYRLAMVAFAETDEAKTLRIVAHAGFEAGYGEAVRLSWSADDPRGRGPGGLAVRSGQPCVVRDIPGDPAFAPWRDDALRRGYRSVLALPLAGGGRNFGVLGIYSAEAGAFGSDEMAILQELAGDLAFGLVALRTRAALGQAEQERLAHVRFLEAMDRIDRALQGAADLERTLGDALEVVLDVLACDRASLVYPCDPDAPGWCVPIERTRPEFPGVGGLGGQMPMTPEIARMHRASRQSDRPVPFGVGTDFPLPAALQDLGGQTGLGMAVYPKVGEPWGFAVQQCAHARTWSPEDERMFLEIGRRLGDGLSSLLAYRRLRDSETRLRTLVQTIPDLVWLKDPEGVFLGCNPRFERLLGAPEARIVGKTDYDFLPREQADFFRDHDRQAMAAGRPTSNEEWLTFADDGYRGLFETVKTPLRGEDGRMIGVLGIARDITARHLAEEELRIAATAFEAQEGIVITDAEERILRVNRAFSEITGYAAADVVGKTPRVLASGRQDAAFYRDMWQRIRREGSWQGEIWNRRKNGQVYSEWLTITAVADAGGTVTHYVGTQLDNTARKAAEQKIEHLAYHDLLTQLPNRRLLQDRLQQALAGGGRSGHRGALLFIDLDNFKLLNDTLGHEVGDRLLVEVARRLAGCVRQGDTVARLGGDEFVVMLEDLSANAREAAAQAQTAAEKVLAALDEPYRVAGLTLHSTPSIGITLFVGDAGSVDELLKQADIAMYQAKAAGRDTLRFFDPEMQASLAARAALEASLRGGIERGEFILHYQPQVDAVRGIIGAEALVRWQRPGQGLVPPAQFIALAEDTGLIVAIGQWVLETACARLAAWQQDERRRGLHLAINVSARQFRQPDFVDRVRQALAASGAPAARLKLELTESLVLHDVSETIARMQALKAVGVGFSMDDFGTGYSSLAYLARLPLDQLKIDQSFVRQLPGSATDAAVVQAIITLARTLGLAVIAEGVETDAQRSFLAERGCTVCQGYLLGRPMAGPDFEAHLDAG